MWLCGGRDACCALATGPLKLNFATGNALAIFIAMAFTWQGNRHFTFRDQRARGLAATLQEWLRFLARQFRWRAGQLSLLGPGWFIMRPSR